CYTVPDDGNAVPRSRPERGGLGIRDFLADLMDNSAYLGFICPTNTAVFMSFFAEFMYAITVILRCDGALLWMINFPLKLSPALTLMTR
ncbi:hypothetical protein VBL29_24595, partial [Enterobacter cloacae]|uniref:hypothetical protein n=1 Tax=Enterobacter cloacae TaxID=550 RepID=UPI002B1DBE7A